MKPDYSDAGFITCGAGVLRKKAEEYYRAHAPGIPTPGRPLQEGQWATPEEREAAASLKNE